MSQLTTKGGPAIDPDILVLSLTGDSGGAVAPSSGNINVVGSGDVSVTGNPATHTLTISYSGSSGASTFNADTGSATPSSGAVTVAGGSNINTVGSGSTLTVNLDNTVSISGSMTAGTGFTATTGGVTIQGGTLKFDDAIQVRIEHGSDTVFYTDDDNQLIVIGEGSGVVVDPDDVGYGNIVIGKDSLPVISTNQSGNIIIGDGVFNGLTTDKEIYDCVIIGNYSQSDPEDGRYGDIVIGQNSGGKTKSSASNVIIGNGAFGDSGFPKHDFSEQNIIIGYDSSGYLQEANWSIILGSWFGTSSYLDNNISNGNILIGNLVSFTGTLEYTTRIGAPYRSYDGMYSGIKDTYIAGIYESTINSSDYGITVTCDDDKLSTINGTDGQVLIAKTSGSPKFATLTSTGGTITFTPGANTLNLEASGGGGGFEWQVVTSSFVNAAPNKGYVVNYAGTCSVEIPYSIGAFSIGDMIRITGMNNDTGWMTGHLGRAPIHFGTYTVTGDYRLRSTHTRDSIELVCIKAEVNLYDKLITEWNVVSSIGNIEIFYHIPM